MELHRPLFTGREVAAALGLAASEFHRLRNVNIPALRLPATRGRSTRDQRWSALDVVRLAIVARLPFALAPAMRKLLFDALGDPECAAPLARACDGRRFWLATDGRTVELRDTPLPADAASAWPEGVLLAPAWRWATEVLDRLVQSRGPGIRDETAR